MRGFPEWMDGWMVGWMAGCMDMDVCLLSGLSGRCRFFSARFGCHGNAKGGETFRFVLFTVARHLLYGPENARDNLFMSVSALAFR